MMKIAFTGKARTGKDHLAQALRREYDLTLYRLAFGDLLKKHAEALFPDYFKDNEKPRKIIQQFGQKMREIDEDVWVRPVINRVRMYENIVDFPYHFDGFVVTDLRQPNEYAALRDAGFAIIRINAPDDVRMQRMIAAGDTYAPEDLTHETESHIDGFAVDYELTNDGTRTIEDVTAELYDFIGGR